MKTKFILPVLAFFGCLVFPASAIDERNWSRVWGSGTNDQGLAVAVDPATNVFVAGYTYGTVHGQPAPGVKSACLTCYDPTGGLRWTVVWGPTNSYAEAHGVAVGGDGHIYVAGLTWASMDGQAAVGNGDFFLTRFKANGERDWTRIWGSSGFDQGNGVAVDGNTNIYVTGSARGSVFGQPYTNRDDFCLSRFTASGSHVWTRMWGGTNATTLRESGQAVAVDSSGDIYVAGFTDVSLDGQPFGGTIDIVLAKYTSNGTKSWLRMWGSSGVDRGLGVVAAPQGSVYVSGYGGSFNGQTSTGSTDPFLLKVSSSGTLQWTRLWGSTGDDMGTAVALDDAERLYITGLAAYGSAFDGQPPYGGGAFLTCYDNAGARQWTKRWGAGDTEGRGVACLGTNIAYAAGYTYGGFDGQPMIGLEDLWVSRWGPPGPPSITAGPTAVNLAATSATIEWTTSRAADSSVEYSAYGSFWEGCVSNADQKIDHSVDLTKLLPGLAYRYRVRSADTNGQSVTSGVNYFTTTAGGAAYIRHEMRAADRYPPEVVTDTTGEVDRVEMTVNGQLVGIAYGGDGAWILSEENGTLSAGENVIAATAFHADGSVAGVSAGSWLYGSTGMPTRVEIEEPWRDYVFHVDGTTAPATSLLFRVLAAKQVTRLVELPGGTGPYGSDSDRMRFEWGSVSNVRFYVDSTLVHTSTNPIPNPVGADLHHEFSCDITGLSTGAYRFHATFTPPSGYRRGSDSRVFRIATRQSNIHAWREVSFNASSNAFLVELHIANRGSGSALVRRIEEPMVGFQAGRIASPWPAAVTGTTFSWGDRACTLALDCDPAATLGAGETVVLRYYAVPILFAGGGDCELGGGGRLTGTDTTGDALSIDLRGVVSTVGVHPHRTPIADAVGLATRSSDYLMITCPPALIDAFGDEAAGDVLEKMAELATYRGAVLGFYHSANWTRTAFRSGDPLAVGYTFKEWEESDQVWVADVSDDRLRAYSRAYQVLNDDIPIPFSADVRAGDSLAVGNFIDCDQTGTNDHPRREIALAYGDGHGSVTGRVYVYSYRYDPETASFASFHVVGTGYGAGGALLSGHFEDSGGDEELAVVMSDGWVKAYSCSGLSASPFATFTTDYRAGDLVAAGNVMGNDFDEIVIGDVSANRIRVVEREAGGDPFHPTFVVRTSITATLDEGDGLAVGDVRGDGREEIVVADASEDRLSLYEVQADGLLHFVESFDWPFDPGDRLAAGRVGSLLKDQVIVARGSEHHGIEAGVVEMFRPAGGQPPGNRFALDDLIDDGGEWADQLADGWVADGHLLLVGETEILPAFRSTFRVYLNAAYETRPADFTDREYADTDADAQKPELSVGRIIGNSADALVRPLQTSIDIASGASRLENDSALAVSGNEDAEDWCIPVRNRIRDKLNARGFSTATMSNEGATNVFDRAEVRDALFFCGHGNIGYWDGLDTGDLDELYQGRGGHPVVYFASCLTGRYPGGYSFAEAFLYHGAAVSVGSTENTIHYGGSGGRGWGPRMADAFFDRLQPEYTIGQSLKHAKRHRMSRAANTYSWDWALNRYHCAIYHLYGDPKLEFDWGAAPAPVPGSLSAAPAPAVAADEPVQGPVSSLAMDIPMFKTAAISNRNYVYLEEGEDVALDGRPLVPLFTRAVAFPPGFCVQNVSMQGRAAPLVYSNLQPVICRMEFEGSVRPAGGLDAGQGAGVWPDRVFDWSLNREATGGSTLYVTAYPFQHDSQTGLSQYFTNYVFDIGFAPSPLDLRGVRTDRRDYTNGQPFVAHVYLQSTNPAPVDAVLHPQVVSVTDGTVIPLPIRRLRGLQGWASCRLAWTVDVADPGDYRLEVAVLDGQETVLDRGGADFVVGIADARLRSFSLAPSPFAIGQPVTLGVTLDNTGTIPLGGSVFFLVQDGAGHTVATYRHDFSGIEPGKSDGFQNVWTASLLPRNCRVIVYAQYEGATTGLQLMADGSGEPLRLDAPAVSEGGGSLRWASLAGRYYTVEATADLAQDFQPVRTNVKATPPYNQLDDLPPEPRVFYRIVEHDASQP